MSYGYSKSRKKLFFLITLCTILTVFVGWIFYISEPDYIDDVEMIRRGTRLEKYDFVSLPKYQFTNEVENAIIIQVDSSNALAMIDSSFPHHDEYVQLKLKEHKYRLVGKGTLYHKVNHFVGFNIFFFTELALIILAGVYYVTLFSTLVSLLKQYDLL
jgi:hypothetical protein